MTTPNEVWDYDLKTRARTLRKRQEVPSGHDPAAYVTRRLLATAPDGETVPISILHRKRHRRSTAPRRCLLYGYGAYGYRDAGRVLDRRGCRWSIAASSMRSRMSAAAPRRAGTGTRTASSRRSRTRSRISSRRPNICVAQGYAAPGKIVAHGGSAGGMLMGAVANMRPDLFAGIIAEVPFVDVINTMLDDTLPLTPPEWQEWGNPIDRRAGVPRRCSAIRPTTMCARRPIRRCWCSPG